MKFLQFLNAVRVLRSTYNGDTSLYSPAEIQRAVNLLAPVATPVAATA